MKKLISFAAIFALAASLFALPDLTFNQKKAIKDEGSKAFAKTTAVQIVKDMKTGWNLGNTMDATNGSGLNSETSWGMPRTEQIMIEMLSMYGMKTIRIPVSWSNHLIDKNYTIDPAWMARVKEIVDWAIEADMYVVINSHHDCYDSPKAMKKGTGKYYPNGANLEESNRFLANIWTQIALAFNNGYDEHLIFETMNEPRLVGTANEWWNATYTSQYKDAAEALNQMNQTALDAIRATGGNNQKRFVIVPGLRAAVDSVLEKEFRMPEDDEPNKLIVSVHMYTPYKFAMEAPGVKMFVDAHKGELDSSFRRLNEAFIQKGYGVFIGEYGATNKDNDEYRALWFDYFISTSRKYGLVACLWDNGVGSPDPRNGEHFGYYNRRQGIWFNDEFMDIINKACEQY